MSTPSVGTPLPRVDGRAKVTGAARYAAEFSQPGQGRAVMVTSTVGRGRTAAVVHRGRPGGGVVGAALQEAGRAAAALGVHDDARRPDVQLEAPGAGSVAPDAMQPGARTQADTARGDSARALAEAPVRVDAT